MSALNLTADERNAIGNLKDFVASRFGLSAFLLFGSRARGDSTHESDIDVMITLRKTNPEIENAIDDHVVSLNIQYDVLMSVVLFSEKELKTGPMSESPLYRTIEKEGVAV